MTLRREIIDNKTFYFFSFCKKSMGTNEPNFEKNLPTVRSCWKRLSQNEEYISNGKSNSVFCARWQIARTSTKNNLSLYSHVLQCNRVLRELHKRINRKRRLVTLRDLDREIADQTSRHVSHENRTRMDQSCHLCRYSNIHASRLWTWTRIAKLQVSVIYEIFSYFLNS